jgi:hypothetical protein
VNARTRGVELPGAGHRRRQLPEPGGVGPQLPALRGDHEHVLGGRQPEPEPRAAGGAVFQHRRPLVEPPPGPAGHRRRHPFRDLARRDRFQPGTTWTR